MPSPRTQQPPEIPFGSGGTPIRLVRFSATPVRELEFQAGVDLPRVLPLHGKPVAHPCERTAACSGRDLQGDAETAKHREERRAFLRCREREREGSSCRPAGSQSGLLSRDRRMRGLKRRASIIPWDTPELMEVEACEHDHELIVRVRYEVLARQPQCVRAEPQRRDED